MLILCNRDVSWDKIPTEFIHRRHSSVDECLTSWWINLTYLACFCLIIVKLLGAYLGTGSQMSQFMGDIIIKWVLDELIKGFWSTWPVSAHIYTHLQSVSNLLGGCTVGQDLIQIPLWKMQFIVIPCASAMLMWGCTGFILSVYPSYWWLSARLQYFQCVSNGVTAFFH